MKISVYFFAMRSHKPCNYFIAFIEPLLIDLDNPYDVELQLFSMILFL